MAIPKLTDSSGSNAVTFTRGEQFPYAIDPYIANQTYEYTRDKYAIVRINGSAQRHFKIVVNNETATTSTALKLFFGTTVNWMENTFRYYPDKDVAAYRTVRLTSPFFRNEQIATPTSGKLYNIDIECKEE